MKKFFARILFPLFLALALALIFIVSPVSAHVMIQAGESPDYIDLILKLALGFASLVGVAGLISALVNLLKAVSIWIGVAIVTDGNSGRWFAGLNVVAFGILVAFQVFRPDITLQFLDGQAGKIAQIMIFILGYLTQLGGGQMFYGVLKRLGIPGLSHSFSK